MREIARGLKFPEGPIALNDGSLLLVEIARGTLVRIFPTGRTSVVAKLGGGPNGAALGPDEAVFICNNGGFEWHSDRHGMRPAGVSRHYEGGSIQRVRLDTGKVDVIYDTVAGRKLCGPNDIVFDRSGGFYFTDFGKTRERARDLGSVYYAKTDGSHIEEVVFPILSPNGIGLSPDENVLYVADTEPCRLWAFDISSPGILEKAHFPSPHGGRLVTGCGGNILQRFDSLAVDELGNINIATLMRGGITVVSPGGHSLRYVSLNDPFTSNICFGGSDMRTAFVTLSARGAVVSMDWPVAGLKLNFRC